MVRITREEAKMLGRRQEQPVKADGELLAVFVRGKLINPLNAGWGWGKQEHGYRRRWKLRVANALFEVWNDRPLYDPIAPKLVAFSARTHNAMDTDGLQAALKPCRDALVDSGVVHGDGPKDGHVWEYSQRVDRRNRGVEIRVRLL